MRYGFLVIMSLLLSLCFLPSPVLATPTEQQGLRLLSAQGAITVDGDAREWDLSAGIFLCADVEQHRDDAGAWFHAMLDADNLYLLARVRDRHPLDNPADTRADDGYLGDCLRLHLLTRPGTPEQRFSHLTCWQGRGGKNAIDLVRGKGLYEGHLRDIKTDGAQQAFKLDADGQGYTQECAIPLKLLVADGVTLTKQELMALTVEIVFAPGVKAVDNFRADIAPERVNPVLTSDCWGQACLGTGAIPTPQPVRLADGRRFPVVMVNGVPRVQWAGLTPHPALSGQRIRFTMPADGYCSLNIVNKQGAMLRPLLTAAPLRKGAQEVVWDGKDARGKLLPPGSYHWRALYHRGIGLQLRGWAGNSGKLPWETAGVANWGGDNGVPAACAADANGVYLGWSWAQAGNAVLALAPDGEVRWGNRRNNAGGATGLAFDNGILYVLNPGTPGIYRLSTATGDYLPWEGSGNIDLPTEGFLGNLFVENNRPDFITVRGDSLYLSYTRPGLLLELNSKTGQQVRRWKVPQPGAMQVISETQLALISEGKAVMLFTPATGECQPLVEGLTNATALARAEDGTLYVGLGQPDNQVLMFTADGKPAGAIGRKGGRPATGPWVADGMASIRNITVDNAGTLWVMEGDRCPKRISAWDTKTRALKQEYFGSTDPDANGGAINPHDPNLLVAQGCEWRIDSQTGRAHCLGVIGAPVTGSYRYQNSANGHSFLDVFPDGRRNTGRAQVYERIGDGQFLLCSDNYRTSTADINQLAQKAPWNRNLSTDSSLLLTDGQAGVMTCAERKLGQTRWDYPIDSVGPDAGHYYPAARPGLIRGASGVAGCARLKGGVGDVWAVTTCTGEWHLLTSDGLYLSRLFQGDPLQVKWPKSAQPGADMTDTPAGSGGSLTQAVDGKVYVLTGQTALLNMQVTGLDSVRMLPGGEVVLPPSKPAAAIASKPVQPVTPAFTPTKSPEMLAMRGPQSYPKEYLRWFAGCLEGLDADVPRIAQSAEMAARWYVTEGLTLGGNGDPGMYIELTGRSGGMMRFEEGDWDIKFQRDKIVLYAIREERFDEELATIAKFKQLGRRVIVFGHQQVLQRVLASGVAIDGMVDNHAAPHGGLFRNKDGYWVVPTDATANVVAAWTWMAEFVSACTRLGKIPILFKGIAVVGGAPRNTLISNTRYADIIPNAIEPERSGHIYLRGAWQNALKLLAHELPNIDAVAASAVEAQQNQHKVYCYLHGHALLRQVPCTNDPHYFTQINGDWFNQRKDIEMKPGDFIFCVGFDTIFRGKEWEYFAERARQVGAKLAWSITTYKPGEKEAILPGEVLVDQRWAYGDSVVPVPGYDVNICPTSAVQGELILWMTNAAVLERLEGNKEGR